jgi:glyoxylate reductase
MSRPVVIALAPASLESFAPLHSLARVVVPEGSTALVESDLISAQAQQPVLGLITPGEFPISEALLDALPDLRVVANTAAGFNNLPLDELARRGIWGTNTPDAFTGATADATMGLILALARRIAAGDAFVRSGRWEQEGAQGDRWSGMELGGKRLGIIGFGKIGQAVARRAEAFGMQVAFHRRETTGDLRQRDLAKLLAESDMVVVLIPLNPGTKHFINADTLAQMKPGAFLVNISRGPVVDEQALVDALREGRLGGAALDVFEFEPKVHADLLMMKQVVLTPHLGGATREARHQARLTASANVAAVLRGERPPGALNEPKAK